MARIRGRDTAPEMALRRCLYANGLRYRVGFRCEGARPDVVFPQARVAVFVDGCFWHGCPIHAVRPKTNAEFWSSKLAGNAARDRRQAESLTAAGWIVLRYWEHEVDQDVGRVANTVVTKVRSRI